MAELLNLDAMRKLPDEAGVGCCVYFLWRGEELLYIGSTISPKRRMYQHWTHQRYGGRRICDTSDNCKSMPFDRATFLKVDEADMASLESDYLEEYATPYNQPPIYRRD